MADAGAPVTNTAAPVAVMGPVVLAWAPAAVAVTSTLNVQELPADKLAPPRLMTLLPAVAEMTPPPQEPVTVLGVATRSPDGRLSMKAIPVSVTALFGFSMVKFRVVEEPTGTANGRTPC